MRDGGRERRIATSDALALALVNGAIKGEPGAVRVQSYLEDKSGILTLPGEVEKRKHGLLVVPRKLPREEWERRAQEALRRVENPPKRLGKVTMTIDGKVTHHPPE